MKWNNRKFVKKQKTGVSKVPKQRKIQTKGLRLAVWGGVIVLSFSGVFAYWQAGTMAVRVRSIDEEVGQVERRLETEDQTIRYMPEIESFMNRFVSLYMNVTTNKEMQDEREKMLLEDYYGNNMNLSVENLKMERSLTSVSFVSLKKVEGLKTATYKVSYTIKTEKDGKMIETKKTQLLNIPYETDGKDCRVISSPYFTAVSKNEYHTKFLGKETANLPMLASPQKEKAQSYIEEFLTKYAESSASDMRYMMKEPEGLDGSAVFECLNSCWLYQEKQGVLAKVSVVFRDEQTSFEWIEQMTLQLVKKDKNYYVEKMTHSWKE